MIKRKKDLPQVPSWTKRYPKEWRNFVTDWGQPPDSHPNAHAANLRIIEVGRAIDLAAAVTRGPQGSPGLMTTILESIVDRIYAEHGLSTRPRCQIEVGPDWLSDYPREYREFLALWGAPTIPGTHADRFNRFLIEHLTPDCVDKGVIAVAAWEAIIRTYAELFSSEPAVERQ